MQTLTDQSTLLRIGAVCAIVGAVIQVAAGTGSSIVFGDLPAGAAAETLLPVLASRPAAWTALQFGFVLGPVFWVIAFVALTPTLPQGASGAFAKLAAMTIVVGAAVHIVASSVNGFGLAAVARAWEGAAAAEQSNLALMGNVLLAVADGTWASSVTLFHGLPFVLSGLAVAFGGRYPALLGWLGCVGGLGSLIAGPFMFFDIGGLVVGLSIVCAVIISIYMLVLGFLMAK